MRAVEKLYLRFCLPYLIMLTHSSFIANGKKEVVEPKDPIGPVRSHERAMLMKGFRAGVLRDRLRRRLRAMRLVVVVITPMTWAVRPDMDDKTVTTAHSTKDIAQNLGTLFHEYVRRRSRRYYYPLTDAGRGAIPAQQSAESSDLAHFRIKGRLRY
jgi:hypothetical protein